MQTKSSNKKVRSRFVKVAKYDTDFCPIHADSAVNSLYYNIFVCSHCGFSYSEDFSRYFHPTTMEIILEKVSSHWVPHHFSKERSIKDAINTYKLASYCGALKKEKHIDLARICLRIAWLYRIKPKQGTRRKIFKFALEEYEASYSTGDFSGTQVSEARILSRWRNLMEDRQ